MPWFLDFLYCFGSKDGRDRDSTRFSCFRAEKTLRDVKAGLDIDALNRSGRRYQLCYTLKSVDPKPESNKPDDLVNKAWRIRSAVVYHQFDVEKATQLWILGDPLQGFRDLIQEHLHEDKIHSNRYTNFAQSLKSSLDAHILYAQWATEPWIWHVQSSEEIIDRIVSILGY